MQFIVYLIFFYNSLVYGEFALDYEYRQHFLCKPEKFKMGCE